MASDIDPCLDRTTLERLATEWEAVRHRIPDGELKEFLCRAVMVATERWQGGEPPKSRPLTVEVMSQENCDHFFRGRVCEKCGLRLYTDENYKSNIGLYSGDGLGW